MMSDIPTLAETEPDVRDQLENLTIELSSGVAEQAARPMGFPGAPRDPYERIADAAQINAFTGIAPRVSLHLPWDRVDDVVGLQEFANEHGVRIGIITSSISLTTAHRLGSLCHPDADVRAEVVEEHLRAVELMRAIGSKELKLRMGDGLRYPGQDSLRDRQERLADSLDAIYTRLEPDERLLLEYHTAGLGCYASDVPDWGTALAQCVSLGHQAFVVLDLGRQAVGANVEFIAMQLLRAGRLGGIDFTARCRDVGLVAGMADPFQTFRVMNELVDADALAPWGRGEDEVWSVDLMVGQGHPMENPVAGGIRSVMNVQEAVAQALLVDRPALADAQLNGDVLGACQILTDSFSADVRPLLAEIREARGLDPDPLAAFDRSGYWARMTAERGGE